MRRFMSLFIVFCAFFTSSIVEAAGPFTQGSGYEKGAYNEKAIQPTSENWSRHSRFDGPVNPVVNWSSNADGWLDSGIAIDENGTMYTGDVEGNVFAVDPAGKVKWKFALGAGVEVRSAPVIGNDGTIYIGAHTASAEKDNIICKKEECLSGLIALNPNGTLKWKVAFPEVQIGNTIILDKNGNIYFGTGDYHNSTGVLYVVTPNGEIIWQYGDDDTEFITAPLLTTSGYLFAHNKYFKDKNFIESLSWNFGTSFASPVVGPDETIYYGTYDGNLIAIGPGAQTKWKLRLSHTKHKVDNVTISSGAKISVTAALANNDILYVGDEDGQLYSIHLSDLAKQPKYEQLTLDWDSDVIKWVLDYEYYEMDDLKDINQFNWVRQTDSWVSSIIVGQNGTIYVGTKEGYIYSYSQSGQLNWKLSLQNENEFSHEIYDLAIDNNHTLYALNGTSMYAIKDKDLSVNKETEIVLYIGSKQAYIQGKSKMLAAAPYIKEGSTLVPLRLISEEFGAKVEWDAKTRYVTVMLDGKKIVLNMDNHFVYVNGERYSLPVKPEIINETTFVPLRFVSEELGKTVKWNGQNRSITIK